MANLIEIAGYVGLSYFLAKLIYEIWQIFYPFIIAKGMAAKRDLRLLSGGSWAVVTGATDGIGKSYAKLFLKRGMNVVLISRNPEKLDAVANEFGKLFPSGEIKTIAFDFAEGKSEDYRRIKEVIAGLDVGILVNNVGCSFKYPERFHLLPDSEDVICRNITVNCFATAMMTRLVLSQFFEKNKGILINIGSQTSTVPTPYLGLYSATKKFVEYFTLSLKSEYGNTGIIFQAVTPFFVATKMSGIRRPTFFKPNPDSYVESALDTVGIQDQTFGCLSHSLQGFVLKFIPERLQQRVTMSVLRSVRAKYLKKAEKTK